MMYSNSSFEHPAMIDVLNNQVEMEPEDERVDR